MNTHAGRIANLRPLLAERGLDAMIVGGEENRRYLTGFSGSAGWAAIGADPDLGLDALFTDFRYLEQARAESVLPVVQCQRLAEKAIIPTLPGRPLRIGLEAGSLTHSLFSRMAAALSAAGHAPEPANEPIEMLRAVKDEGELETIARAAAIADRLMTMIPTLYLRGMSELDLARELVINALRLGSEREAFRTIVASGPRSALAHGRPTDRRPAEGDLVLVDLGAVVDGYHSDISRTFVVGAPDDRQLEAHRQVLAAQTTALAALRPGAAASDVDAAARDSLDAAGVAPTFGHALGHGVGLSLGEMPTLGPGCPDILSVGMVMTVEPGIYEEGWGGIRIEDLVHITADGYLSFTSAPRALVSL